MDLNKPGPLYDAIRARIEDELGRIPSQINELGRRMARADHAHSALSEAVGPAKERGAEAWAKIEALEATVAAHEKAIAALAVAKARPSRAKAKPAEKGNRSV